MSDAAVAALAGVVVGALLNFALTQYMERRKERRIARGTARLVDRALLEAILHLDYARKMKSWPPSEGFQFRTEGWREHRVELARVVNEDWEFDPLDDAFLFLETENERVRSGRAVYDEEGMKRLHGQVHAARIAVAWHSYTERHRFKMWLNGIWARIRRLPSRVVGTREQISEPRK